MAFSNFSRWLLASTGTGFSFYVFTRRLIRVRAFLKINYSIFGELHHFLLILGQYATKHAMPIPNPGDECDDVELIGVLILDLAQKFLSHETAAI